MNPAKMLARLTVRSTGLGERSNGGTGGITPQDIAAACAGMSDAQYLLLLRIYTQDVTVQPRLFYAIYDQAIGIATCGHWRLPVGKELVRKMTNLALAEMISPRVCPDCEGKAQVWLKGMAVPTACKPCGGSGRKSLSSREKARLLEMDDTTFSRYWSDRYDQVFAHVAELESSALRLLVRKFRVDEKIVD